MLVLALDLADLIATADAIDMVLQAEDPSRCGREAVIAGETDDRFAELLGLFRGGGTGEEERREVFGHALTVNAAGGLVGHHLACFKGYVAPAAALAQTDSTAPM